MVSIAIYGSKCQQIGNRVGMEIFNHRNEKVADVDYAGRLLDPKTQMIIGFLQPVDSQVQKEKSLDRIFA